jgi:hypothetical protein
MPELMRQEAPYPTVLDALVRRLEYRDGWDFSLVDLDRGQGSKGLTLIIRVTTVNSYPPHEPLRVAHYMPVPPAAYDERSWQRWLFDQILLVERHEACEFFRTDGLVSRPGRRAAQDRGSPLRAQPWTGQRPVPDPRDRHRRGSSHVIPWGHESMTATQDPAWTGWLSTTATALILLVAGFWALESPG